MGLTLEPGNQAAANVTPPAALPPAAAVGAPPAGAPPTGSAASPAADFAILDNGPTALPSADFDPDGPVPGMTPRPVRVRLPGEPVAGSPSEQLYQRLSPREQRAFRELGREHQPAFTALMESANPSLQLTMLMALRQGVLLQRSSDGTSVLDQLTQFRSVPLQLPQPPAGAAPATEEAYRDECTQAMLRHILEPTYIQQSNHGTCGATAIQIEMASQSPVDYIRFLTGLLSPSGQGRLPDGTVVRREESALRPGMAGDERDRVSRVFQASLTAAASPVQYRDSDDRHSLRLPIPLIGDVGPQGGMLGADAARLFSATRREPLTPLLAEHPLTIPDGGGVMGVRRSDVVASIDSDLVRQRGLGRRQAMVPVAMTWGSSTHWINVTQMTQDRVFFLNPQGNRYGELAKDSAGQLRPVHFDPDLRMDYIDVPDYDHTGLNVRIYQDGSSSMTREQLQDHILETLVAPPIAQSYQAQPHNQFRPPI